MLLDNYVITHIAKKMEHYVFYLYQLNRKIRKAIVFLFNLSSLLYFVAVL